MIALFYREEDENFNSLLQNGDVNVLIEEKLNSQDKITNLSEFSLNIEKKLALLEKGVELNNATDESHNLHQINRNICKLAEEGLQSNVVNQIKSTEMSIKDLINDHMKEEIEQLENENKYLNVCPVNNINGHSEDMLHSAGKSELKRSATIDTDSSSELCLSKSTEDLSPQRSGPVVKSHSITNMETGALKVCDIINDSGSQHPNPAIKSAGMAADGKNIVRSKSATVLYDQPLQVFPGCSSSSDLISTKTAIKFDFNHNPEDTNTVKGQGPNSPQPITTPQYNIQYSSNIVPKESLWLQKQNPIAEQSCLSSQRLLRLDSTESCTSAKHSANMNFSNHNNVRASAAYNMHQRMGGRHMEMWAVSPNDRHPSSATRNTLQRQNSVSSTASVNVDSGSSRRPLVSEGDYLTYRDLHSVGRVPPKLSGQQRPLSARTHSIDGPNVPRPQSARPSANDIPERTMSVSDFNYSRTSPSKRTNPRVNSEFSLMDPTGKNKVPHDWREQVLRHIEAKKLEKVSNFTSSS